MDAAVGEKGFDLSRDSDPHFSSGSPASLKSMPAVFDEAFRAGVECFGRLLEQQGLTRENMRLLRSFADVVSARVLLCCAGDETKASSCFMVSSWQQEDASVEHEEFSLNERLSQAEEAAW